MRTPSSSHKALCIIHDYLVVCAPTVYTDGNSPSISNTIPSINRANTLIWQASLDQTNHFLSLGDSCIKKGCDLQVDSSRYADQVLLRAGRPPLFLAEGLVVL